MVEKALKAGLWAARGLTQDSPVLCSNNVEWLADTLGDAEGAPDAELPARRVAAYFANARHPHRHPGGRAPHEVYTAREAEAAGDVARDVLDEITMYVGVAGGACGGGGAEP